MKKLRITAYATSTFVVISLVGFTQLGFAQIADIPNMTNFETLFYNDPQYKLCRQSYANVDDPLDTSSQPETVCDVTILTVGHETNNSLMINTNHPGYLGPALDAIYKDGYKSELVIPHSPDDNGAWIYFRK